MRAEDSCAPELLALTASDSVAAAAPENSVAAAAPAFDVAPSPAAPRPQQDLKSCSFEQLMAEVKRRQSEEQQSAEEVTGELVRV